MASDEQGGEMTENLRAFDEGLRLNAAERLAEKNKIIVELVNALKVRGIATVALMELIRRAEHESKL